MKRDFKDKTFALCNEYPEFRQYLTGIGDLKKCPQKEIIKDDFERLMLDSLFYSPGKDILVDIEHQSQISDKIMFRNIKYHVNTRDKYNKELRLHIFHTGPKKAPNNYMYDEQIFHFPYLNQTCLRDGIKTFNRIKNKVENNQKISYDDIFDLVWLPCFGKIEINDHFLREYIDITSQLKYDEHYDLLKRTTRGWIETLTKNKEIINHLKEKLDMMELNSPEFAEYIATARDERELREKDEIIKQKDEEIKQIKSQKDKELTQKDEEITQIKSQKDEELTQKDEELKLKDKEITELKQIIEQNNIIAEKPGIEG